MQEIKQEFLDAERELSKSKDRHCLLMDLSPEVVAIHKGETSY
jgi:hypothetical protein